MFFVKKRKWVGLFLIAAFLLSPVRAWAEGQTGGQTPDPANPQAATTSPTNEAGNALPDLAAQLRIRNQVEKILLLHSQPVTEDLTASPPRVNAAADELKDAVLQSILASEPGRDTPLGRKVLNHVLEHFNFKAMAIKTRWALGKAKTSIPAQTFLVFLCSHFILTPVLGLTGFKTLAFIFGAFPTASVGYATSAYSILGLLTARELARIHGGFRAFLKDRRAQKEALKRFSLKDANAILESCIGPGTEGNEAYAISKNSGRIRQILQAMGLNSKRLTLDRLAKFLKDNNFEPEEVRKFEKMKGIPDQDKAGLLLMYVAMKGDEPLKASLREKFQSNLVKLNAIPYGQDGLREWAERFGRVNTSEEVEALLHQAPKARVDILADLWQHAILPVLAERLPHLSEEDVPQLQNEFSKVVAQARVARNQGKPHWTPEWVTKFVRVLGGCPTWNLATQHAPEEEL